MESSDALKEALRALREQMPTSIEGVRTGATVYFNRETALTILEHYMQGVPFEKIARMGGMPSYPTILNWSKEHPAFRDALEGVRAARALHFEDKAIMTAEEAEGKDADRLRFEAYKWGAEVNDPLRYGKKVTHAGDASNPIQILVTTGFGEPNEFQKPPRLGTDGIVEKPVIEVKPEPKGPKESKSQEENV